MDKLTKAEYITRFGDKMWQEKVGEDDVECVYATDSGNIFMIIKEEEA